MKDTGSTGATASAPGKVILFGEHFVVYGTGAILCAIDRRIYVTASRSRDIRIISEMGTLECDLAGNGPDEINPTLRPLYHIAREALDASGLNGGITLSVKSDIPPGAGLGSSSACCVAGAAAALQAVGVDAPQERIIKLAMDAERTVFPGASGADTAASLLGGMITYNKDAGYRILETARDVGFGLVVSDSNIIHNTAEMVKKVSRFKDCNKAEFKRLCRKEASLVSQVSAMLELYRHTGDHISTVTGLGRFASLNQEYLREIGVSNRQLDEMICKMDEFSYGSKITGAGGGGCIIGFAASKNMQKRGHEEHTSPYDALLSTSARRPPSIRHDTAETVAERLSEVGHDCFAASIDRKGLVSHTSI